MAEADAKPPPPDPAASPVSSISPSVGAWDAADADAIEMQLAGLGIAVALDGGGFPEPSGWDDGPVPVPIPAAVLVGGDEGADEQPRVPAPTGAVDVEERYPLRPGQPDCIYYLRTGTCGFGTKCKYNHPARKRKRKSKSSTPLLDEAAITIEDDERTRDEARRKEKKEQQRNRYMKWRLCFSFFGHCFLFALSFIPGLGQETSGQKWLTWGMMDVIVPLALLIVMIIIQVFYIDLEDISPDKNTVKRCKIVNLVTISCSKLVYVAISKAPAGANVTVLSIIAHAIAFLIDMVGAIYLYRNHSCYELDNI